LELRNNRERAERSKPHDGGQKTDSGIPVKPIYGPSDIARKRIDYEKDIGYPGRFPFTRGIYQGMYTERLWTMRQYTGFGNAAETNRRFRYLLSQGQTGLSVAFDLPTQLGLDSDDPMAAGEVGKVGVAVSSLRDMETLFADIPVDKVSTSMTINATASIMLSMYIANARERGIHESRLRGTTQNDILKEYIARNTYIYPPEPSLKIATDIIVYCVKEMPKWHPISISGYHIREAGANAIQELSFAFADAIEYSRSIIDRGMKIDEFAPHLSFFFASRNDFFEEIAKFRAARKIWARIVREEFNPRNEESMKLKFHVQTSGETLTAQQPENNVVRVTIQALAAVLGGTQSLHTNSLDEALSLPSQKAVTLALRTQQIIANESGVTRIIDPLAGSYYIESLTKEIEEEVFSELDRIEKLGGALQAIKSGYMQREIQKNAYEFQKQVDSGEKIIVGVNKYVSGDRPQIRLHKVTGKSEKEQLRRIESFKKKRDKAKLNRALEDLSSVLGNPETNVMPFIINAVEAHATTGEIASAFRKIYGEFKPPLVA
jgi:methylmalonyl-CoA mutase N-terminal domain/subunit